jgi:hypothetical protein
MPYIARTRWCRRNAREYGETDLRPIVAPVHDADALLDDAVLFVVAGCQEHHGPDVARHCATRVAAVTTGRGWPRLFGAGIAGLFK